MTSLHFKPTFVSISLPSTWAFLYPNCWLKAVSDTKPGPSLWDFAPKPLSGFGAGFGFETAFRKAVSDRNRCHKKGGGFGSETAFMKKGGRGFGSETAFTVSACILIYFLTFAKCTLLISVSWVELDDEA